MAYACQLCHDFTLRQSQQSVLPGVGAEGTAASSGVLASRCVLCVCSCEWVLAVTLACASVLCAVLQECLCARSRGWYEAIVLISLSPCRFHALPAVCAVIVCKTWVRTAGHQPVTSLPVSYVRMLTALARSGTMIAGFTCFVHQSVWFLHPICIFFTHARVLHLRPLGGHAP
jgi:hypothetical protein